MTTQPSKETTTARRDVLRGAVLAATGGLLLGPTARAEDATANSPKIRALHPNGAPAADASYSPANVETAICCKNNGDNRESHRSSIGV